MRKRIKKVKTQLDILIELLIKKGIITKEEINIKEKKTWITYLKNKVKK